jgi:two-component system, LytTR family, sensor kinase
MTLEVFTWILFIALLLLAVLWVARNLENRKKKRLQFALLAFQSHTNPHFIKNVLQAINWFILNNEKNLASDYLCDFSKLMEDILSFSKKNFVTLSEKLEFLDLYLKLQHLRHKDKFDYVSIHNEEEEPTIQID